MRLNDDLELVNEVKKALIENKEKYGKPYCPCVVSEKYFEENSNDYICPCKDFRENTKQGEECHCGLYIK